MNRWWAAWRTALFTAALVLVASGATLKLGDEFRRLTVDQGRSGAIDLQHLHAWVHEWFAGQPVYELHDQALYPPATHLILWPLLGWLPLAAARWFWAATALVALALSAWLLVRLSGAATWRDRLLVALLLLAINGTGVAIGNGQLILHLLPALLGALWLANTPPRSGRRDWLAAALLAVALVKPSVTVPFLVLVCVTRWRVGLLAVVIYAGLTVWAMAYQPTSLGDMLRACVSKGSTAVIQFPGYGNIHAALVAIGCERGLTTASLGVLGLFGLWAWRYRQAEVWVLAGVTALVALFWTYHRMYDNVLVAMPAIALYRVTARTSDPTVRTSARWALGLTIAAMLCPARLLCLPAPLGTIFRGGQCALWLVLAGLLIAAAHRQVTTGEDRERSPAAGSQQPTSTQ